MDKIVEIANFQQPEKAELLASLLRAEGIECYVRNEISSRVLRGYADIGARVEILDKDIPSALEIMKNAGYTLPDEEIEAPGKDETGLVRHIPILRNLSLEKQLVIVIGLILGLIAVMIYLQSYFSAEKW